MTLLQFLQHNPTLLISSAVLLGFMVGSFINVVVYRLPIMMDNTYRSDCREYLELPAASDDPSPFNLAVPGSHCPNCSEPVHGYQNIPIISYLFLRGRCSNCNTPISIRYPIVEALTALFSGMVAWKFGYSTEMIFALILTWSLLGLSLIDLDHQILPDTITLPLLWLGLFISIFSVWTTSHSSIIGAIAGYMSFWLVFQVFKLITGKEGLGYGDFKLLAALGAWLGWQLLPLIILLSSVVGAIVGVLLISIQGNGRDTPIPYGPYLSAAGWIALLWGNQLTEYYLRLTGL